MNLKKISLALILLAVAFFGYRGYSTYQSKKSSELHSFTIVTLTKSGTHMVVGTLAAPGLLTQLTGLMPNDHGGVNLDQDSYNFYHGHISHSLEKQLFSKNKFKKKIFLVRDLRDILVSYSYWLGKDFVHLITENDKTQFNALPTQQEKMKWIINHKYDDNSLNPWGHSLSKQAKLITKYKDRKDVLIVRFENLVGSQGGGDDELQFLEVKKIAEFINSPLKNDDAKLRAIASSMFGNKTRAFRKGQIGSWKEYFDGDLTALFENELGTYQKELGYS